MRCFASVKTAFATYCLLYWTTNNLHLLSFKRFFWTVPLLSLILNISFFKIKFAFINYSQVQSMSSLNVKANIKTRGKELHLLKPKQTRKLSIKHKVTSWSSASRCRSIFSKKKTTHREKMLISADVCPKVKDWLYGDSRKHRAPQQRCSVFLLTKLYDRPSTHLSKHFSSDG